MEGWQWAYRGLLPDDLLDGLSATIALRTARRRAALADPLPEARTWLASDPHGRLVGFADSGPARDTDLPLATAEVYTLYVAPDTVGRGVGRALFEHTLDDLARRGFGQAVLWVLATNQRGRRFYEAAGWRPDGAAKVEGDPPAVLHEVRYRASLRPLLAERDRAER